MQEVFGFTSLYRLERVRDMKYIYGPVPSRRLGSSLGVSPIPKKTCNYSCIYCQLGRTDRMTNTRRMFYPVREILEELDEFLKSKVPFDIVTIVGEGEPTLYLGLGELIDGIRTLTDKGIAVITNGALLYDKQLQEEIGKADIVLPTVDAWDEASFKKINRPHGSLKYEEVVRGLEEFSQIYQGQIWIELMLMKGINDDDASLAEYARMIRRIRHEKVYLNTPVRPPAEAGVEPLDHERMEQAAALLEGISIDLLESGSFHSEIRDDYEALLCIIKRHPMNRFEILGFLEGRKNSSPEEIFSRLHQDQRVEAIDYKGILTYRLV